MVAFEPCLATVALLAMGPKTPPYIYHTIPIPYQVADLSQISGASAFAIDRRFEQGDSRISLLLWRAGQRCER